MSDREVLDAESHDAAGRRSSRLKRAFASAWGRVRHRDSDVGRPRRWYHRLPAIAAVALGVLALVIIASTAVGGWLVQRSYPQTTGELEVVGLDAPVDVLRDARGVPTVEATSTHDLFFAQGFVHAQDRFWEMDVRRHITAGRLSEMFGDTQVETDEFVRTLGWRRIAEQEVELLSPQTIEALQAYADGVNAYLADRGPTQISLEYAALGVTARDYQIEPWTPVDSVAWLKAMAWDLRANLEEETDRALVEPVVGTRVLDLYPRYPFDRNAPILERGAVVDGEWDPTASSQTTLLLQTSARPGLEGQNPSLVPPPGLFDDARAGVDQLDRWLGAYGPGVGSNSFAVTGKHSASGGALLANDPHLAPSLPSIWYQMNLQCAEVSDACPYDVGGFTFSGVPGVIIGHNDHIAWGFTNNGADVMDLGYEALNGTQYVRDGELRDLKVRTETIDVAGGDPVDVTIRSTDWGPLLSDVSDPQQRMIDSSFDVSTLPPQADEVAVALKWTALQPGRTADAILAVNLASTFDEFRDAARHFEVPSQNMLYADVDGHIGYQMPGRVPGRTVADGTVPVGAWDSATAWRRFIPFDELPWDFDPPQQYIVAANQAVTENFPTVLTRDWGYGYRSQRLADLIEESPPLTPELASELMMDNSNEFAPVLIAELFDLDESLLTDDAREARELLRTWDHHQDADSAAAAYYNAVWRQLLALIFEDELTGDQRPNGGDRWFEVMRSIINSASGVWWDDVRTDDIELRDDIYAAALNNATDELTDQLGSDPEEWQWGDLHQLDLTHATLGSSGIAPLEALFNRGPIAVAGGEGIVNATGWTPYDGYEVTWVPSMRMVVDLTDLDASRWVQLTGQSGHVFNPHYTDQVDAWAAGDTYRWPFSSDAVADTTDEHLVMSPQ